MIVESLGEIVGYNFGTYSPGVRKKEDGSYTVRILDSYSVSRSGSRSTSYAYFDISKDGIITSCPRGTTKMFKGRKVEGLDEAVERYKEPK